MRYIMRKRTTIAFVLASIFAFNAGSATVEASWLSKTLDKIDKALGVPNSKTEVTQQSDGYLHLPQVGERWILISENKYYKTYLDRRTALAVGEAQERKVAGIFKKEFTPLGSQWLGIVNKDIKPDVITVGYVKMFYGVNEYGVLNNPSPEYHDVHGNLIYKDDWIRALEIQDKGFTNAYVPESEQELIKDRVFHLFGWDY